MASRQESHFVSAPIDLEGKAARLALNIEGISAHSGVTVEILDERFNPLPNYTADRCNPPTVGGLKQAVTWGEQDVVAANGRIRLRVHFTGLRPEDVKLYAVYLTASV